MLSWLSTVKVRTHARQTWIASGNNSDLAEELFREIYADADDKLTDEALSVAFGCWQYWIDRGISEPPEIPDAKEPRFRE